MGSRYLQKPELQCGEGTHPAIRLNPTDHSLSLRPLPPHPYRCRFFTFRAFQEKKDPEAKS